MKKLEYKIAIAASGQKVWKTMLDADTYKQWVAASWPGSYYEGKWEEGENIRFISENGSGTLATITALQPYDYLAAEHIAVLLPGGIEDRNSDQAKGWIGTKESYRFTKRDGHTQLVVEIITNPEWEQMFNDGWPNTLKKLKEISEK